MNKVGKGATKEKYCESISILFSDSMQVIPGCNPPTNRSCHEIQCCFPSAPSGNYQIQLFNGSAVEVYCDMEGTNCGGEGGWTRVAYVNMTKTGATCPQGLTERNFSGLILCSVRDDDDRCQGTVFSTLGLNYSQVCGQLRGFQFGELEAFAPFFGNPPATIDDAYLEGASITYGSSPRRHIWSYTSGHTVSRTDRFGCPCNTGSTVSPPSFVGNDYYCESATTSSSTSVLHSNDPLWDGQQCTGLEGPCCTNSNLPWFNKTLAATTNEDIELRLCQDNSITSEGSPLQVIELYIR